MVFSSPFSGWQCQWLTTIFCLCLLLHVHIPLPASAARTHTHTHTHTKTKYCVIGFILSGSSGLLSNDNKLFGAERPNSVYSALCGYVCIYVFPFFFLLLFFNKYTLSSRLTPYNLFTVMHTLFNGRPKKSKRNAEQTQQEKPWGEFLEVSWDIVSEHTHTHTHTHIYIYTKVYTHTHGHVHNGWVKAAEPPISFRFTPAHGKTANQQHSIKWWN